MTDFNRKDGRIAASRGYHDFSGMEVKSLLEVPAPPPPPEPVRTAEELLANPTPEELLALGLVSTDFNYTECSPLIITDRVDWGPDIYNPNFLIGSSHYYDPAQTDRTSGGHRYLNPVAEDPLLGPTSNPIFVDNNRATAAGDPWNGTRDCVYKIPWYCPPGIDPGSLPNPVVEFEFWSETTPLSPMYIRRRDSSQTTGLVIGPAIETTVRKSDRMSVSPLFTAYVGETTFVYTTGWNYIPFTIDYGPYATDIGDNAFHFAVTRLWTCLPLGVHTRVLSTPELITASGTPDVTAVDSQGDDCVLQPFPGEIGAPIYPANILHSAVEGSNVERYALETWDPVWANAQSGTLLTVAQSFYKIKNSLFDVNRETGFHIHMLDPWGTFKSGNGAIGPMSDGWASNTGWTAGTTSNERPGVVHFTTSELNMTALYSYIHSFRGLVILERD